MPNTVKQSFASLPRRALLSAMNWRRRYYANSGLKRFSFTLWDHKKLFDVGVVRNEDDSRNDALTLDSLQKKLISSFDSGAFIPASDREKLLGRTFESGFECEFSAGGWKFIVNSNHECIHVHNGRHSLIVHNGTGLKADWMLEKYRQKRDALLELFFKPVGGLEILGEEAVVKAKKYFSGIGDDGAECFARATSYAFRRSRFAKAAPAILLAGIAASALTANPLPAIAAAALDAAVYFLVVRPKRKGFEEYKKNLEQNLASLRGTI